MHTYVCIYIYMYLLIYTIISCTPTYMYMYICVYICAHIHIHIYINVCTHIYIYTLCTHIYTLNSQSRTPENVQQNLKPPPHHGKSSSSGRRAPCRRMAGTDRGLRKEGARFKGFMSPTPCRPLRRPQGTRHAKRPGCSLPRIRFSMSFHDNFGGG